MLGCLSLNIRQVLVMAAIETILVSGEHPKFKKGKRSSGNSNFRRSKTPRRERLEPKKAMEVRCSVPERSVLSVVVLTVESAYSALMTASVAVRVGTWLETVHRTEVRLE